MNYKSIFIFNMLFFTSCVTAPNQHATSILGDDDLTVSCQFEKSAAAEHVNDLVCEFNNDGDEWKSLEIKSVQVGPVTYNASNVQNDEDQGLLPESFEVSANQSIERRLKLSQNKLPRQIEICFVKPTERCLTVVMGN